MNHPSFAAIAALLIVGLSGCATSPPANGKGPPAGRGFNGESQTMRRATIDAVFFAGFDADRDGGLTFGELEAGVDAAMVRADLDRNGGLSGLELRAMGVNEGGDASAAPMLGVVDPDGDNLASFADVARWAMARARALDANGDKSLSRAELWEDVRVPSQGPRKGTAPGDGAGDAQKQRPPQR